MDTFNLSGRTLGQYRILRLIGTGGMAQVYLALQPALNRNVAVKILAPSLADDAGFVTRFRREATLVAGMLHPNILPVHDFGNEGGLLYLVMTYVPGGSLHERMQSPLDWNMIVRIVGQIADGLDYAHQLGIVHRDLKPGNIFMGRPDYPLVGDFGIARIIEVGGLTVAGTTVGTPEYMSPEQGLGKPVDGRSDIYALGVILYKLLTGRVPFSGSSDFSILHKHVYDPPAPPSSVRPGIPPGLEVVTIRALAKQPEDRFQTAAQLKAALEHALAAPSWGQSPSWPPVVTTMPAPDPPSMAVPVSPEYVHRDSLPPPSPPYSPALNEAVPYVPPSYDPPYADPPAEPWIEPASRFNWLPLMLGSVAALVALCLVGTVFVVLTRPEFAQVRGQPTTVSSTPIPNTPVPGPTSVPVGQVLFEDLMRVDHGRWPTGRTNEREASFANGAYQILTPATNQNAAMLPLQTRMFTSFAYEADLRKVAGRDDSGYGLSFRVHGTESWYNLLVTGDQRYCLSIWVATLQGNDFLIPCTKSTAINAGNAVNRVRIVARGPELMIFINDTFVAQTTETRRDAATTGGIGLSAGPGVTVAVSSVRVYALN